MTKTFLIVSFLFLSISFVFSTHKNIPCFCPLVYFPICAYDGNTFSTFSNDCFARCANSLMVYSGECKQNNTLTSSNCVSECGKNYSWVCTKKDNSSVSVPSPCIAQCQNMTIVKNGTCNNKRILGFFDSLKDKFNKAKAAVAKAAQNTKNAISNAVDKTKAAVKNAVNKTKTAFKKAANKTKHAIKNFANKTKHAIKKAANKTKNAISKAVDKAKEIYHKVVAALRNRIRQIGEAFQNCTCHVVSKMATATKNKLAEWEQKAKEEFARIKNKTVAWWDQTRDGFINAGKKVAGWLDKQTCKAINATVLIWVKTRDAFNRKVDWFKKFVSCAQCNNKYEPVCIKADNGEKATILNQCYADCGDLVTLYTGRCLDDDMNADDGESFVFEHVGL